MGELLIDCSMNMRINEYEYSSMLKLRMLLYTSRSRSSILYMFYTRLVEEALRVPGTKPTQHAMIHRLLVHRVFELPGQRHWTDRTETSSCAST